MVPVHRTRTEPPVSTNVCSLTGTVVTGAVVGDVVGSGRGADVGGGGGGTPAATVVGARPPVGAGAVVVVRGVAVLGGAVVGLGPGAFEGAPGALGDDASAPAAGPATSTGTDPPAAVAAVVVDRSRAISVSIWLRDTVAAGRVVTFAPAICTARVASAIAIAVPAIQTTTMPARRRTVGDGSVGGATAPSTGTSRSGSTRAVWSTVAVAAAKRTLRLAQDLAGPPTGTHADVSCRGSSLSA